MQHKEPRKLTAAFCPLWEMVCWVSYHGDALGVQHAKDRPWYYSAEAPAGTSSGHVLACRCKEAVAMRLHQWETGGRFWCGQCGRCSAILWHVPEGP